MTRVLVTKNDTINNPCVAYGMGILLFMTIESSRSVLSDKLSASEVTKADWRLVMGRILEAFAEDELHAILSNEIRSPKYQKLCDEVCQLQDKPEEKLNNEEKGLLNELMNAIADENCSYVQSKFIRGYHLGVLMTMEVMSEQETLLGRKGSRR